MKVREFFHENFVERVIFYSFVPRNIKLLPRESRVCNVCNNYLKLLYREFKGILPYQGFSRPIFVSKICRGNLWLSKNFNFPKKQLFIILSSIEMKMHEFFPQNFAKRVVILHHSPKGRWRNHRSIILVKRR